MQVEVFVVGLAGELQSDQEELKYGRPARQGNGVLRFNRTRRN